MITRDLRRSIARAVAAAGYQQGKDPGLRPTGIPGQYAASIALTLGAPARETAGTLAAALVREDWIATAAVTGPGYLTVTVTPAALAAVADTVINAGPACVTSDALAGHNVLAAAAADPLSACTWEEARAALAVRLTARLAAAAGATVAATSGTERVRVSRQAESSLRAAVAFAGRDAVLFTLARAVPGKLLRVEPEIIARHVLGNPAYAVRYAHARAASGMRWAAASPAADTIGAEGAPEPFFLDALSWLPERVATAARRGRPDEFARYLEDLASVTIDMLSATSRPGRGVTPGNDRLALAKAAQTGLAAGLGLLEVGAPERL